MRVPKRVGIPSRDRHRINELLTELQCLASPLDHALYFYLLLGILWVKVTLGTFPPSPLHVQGELRLLELAVDDHQISRLVVHGLLALSAYAFKGHLGHLISAEEDRMVFTVQSLVLG